jgi:hypothetical protein
MKAVRCWAAQTPVYAGGILRKAIGSRYSGQLVIGHDLDALAWRVDTKHVIPEQSYLPLLQKTAKVGYPPWMVDLGVWATGIG